MGKTEEKKLAFEGSGITDLISWEEIKEKQYFVIPCTDEIKDQPPGLSPFAEDPKANPLTTPTGLLEYSSSALEKHFPDDPERPPVAQWVEKSDFHDERVTSERAEWSRCFACLTIPAGVCAQGDVLTWTREIETMKVKGAGSTSTSRYWLNPRKLPCRAWYQGATSSRSSMEQGIVHGAPTLPRAISRHGIHGPQAPWGTLIIPVRLTGAGPSAPSPPHNIVQELHGMVVSGLLVEVANRSVPRRWPAGAGTIEARAERDCLTSRYRGVACRGMAYNIRLTTIR